MAYEYKYECLKGLEPAEFFYWFGEISVIPRETKFEQKFVEFLQSFAAERGIPCDTDEIGNVFMTIPATPGYEDQPAILFQAHTDLVAEKDPDSDFDFAKDALRLAVDGDKLYAEGTTLGADNGVGVATMLALADPESGNKIPHPPLELLFTVQEENGLIGIRHFDCSKIKARRMLNMDCGYTNEFCVSSAGKIGGEIIKKFEPEILDESWKTIEIKLFGGMGGHSGIMINRSRACAVNNMGELICTLMLGSPSWNEPEKTSVRIVSLTSDKKPIQKECEAVIAVPADEVDKAIALLEKRFTRIKAIYKNYDPDIQMTVSVTDKTFNTALSEKDSATVAKVLVVLRTGQYRADGNLFSTIITSGAIMRSALSEEGTFEMIFSVRSCSDPDQEMLFNKYAFLAEMLGMEMKVTDSYSGWPEDPDSVFCKKFINGYKELFGKDIAIERVHGGIETGHIVGQIPDMDAAGYAPTATQAHTTRENLEISQVMPFWQLLKKVLAEKE